MNDKNYAKINYSSYTKPSFHFPLSWHHETKLYVIKLHVACIMGRTLEHVSDVLCVMALKMFHYGRHVHASHIV